MDKKVRCDVFFSRCSHVLFSYVNGEVPIGIIQLTSGALTF